MAGVFTLLPLGLGAFSMYGTVSAFGATPTVLGIWLTTAFILVLIVKHFPQPTGVCLYSASRKLQLPGSWVPMSLMMATSATSASSAASLRAVRCA